MTTIPTFNDPTHGLSTFLNVGGIGDAIVTPFASRALHEAATIPATVTRTAHLAANGDTLWYKPDASGTALTTAGGRKWSPDGAATPQHFGAAGDGITDDGSAVAACFAFSRHIRGINGSTYRIVSRNIPVIHPTIFDGAGVQIVFENMGGFLGTDGFSVSIPEAAPFGAETAFRDFRVAICGQNMARLFRTPRETPPWFGSSNYWSLRRPTYVFENIFIGERSVDATGSSIRTDYAAARFFDIGDSQKPILQHITIGGSFKPDVDPATQVDELDSVGIFLGGDPVTARGAVYMPKLSHIDTANVGTAVFGDYRTSDGTISDSQFLNGGYGLKSTVAVSGGLGLTELQMHNVNFNGSHSQIDIAETDFLLASNLRVTRPSSAFAHTEDWYGLRIGTLARQVLATNFSAINFNNNPNNKFYTVDLNGVSGAAFSGVFLRNDIGAADPIKGISIEGTISLSVSGVVAQGVADSVDYLVHLRDGAVLSPVVRVTGNASAVFKDELTKDAAVSLANVYTNNYGVNGMDASISVISASGSETVIVAESAQVIRRAINASGINHVINISNLGALFGDQIYITMQLGSGANSSSSFVVNDGVGVTQLTLAGTGVLRRVSAHLARTTSGAWRVVSAVDSLA
jgi:hypothetical protein